MNLKYSVVSLLILTILAQSSARMFEINQSVSRIYNLPPALADKLTKNVEQLEICTQSYFQKIIPGYPIETHAITTEDGYILTAFRIQAKGSTIKSGKPVVFLQHGINDTGLCFFFNDADKALGTLLADSGFDVWIGNTRGNKFSRAHTKLKINSKEFWMYSFMQMGQYDVPANVQYIKNKTGAPKITYIGHSQGTTQMFAALSDPAVRPKVAPYLNSFYALAPVVFLVRLPSNYNLTICIEK